MNTPKREMITEKKLLQMAESEKISFTDIMSWFCTCKSFHEKVEITKLMKARMEACIKQKKIW